MSSGLAAATICFVISTSDADGRGIAARVIVDQDDGAGAQFKAAFDDLPRVDGRVIDRAATLDFVAQQLVLAIEEEDAELLVRFARHLCHAVIDERPPRRQRDVLLLRLFAQQTAGGCANDLQLINDGLAHAFDFLQPVARG